MHATIAFVASLGVNTHLGFVPTYADTAAVMKSLRYLGIYNVRDYAPHADSSNMARWGPLAAGGVNFTFILDERADINDFLARLHNFTSRYPGRITYAEGPNEIWNWPVRYRGLTGMDAGAAVQRSLFAAIKGDRNLSGLPVLTLTTGGGSPGETFQKLGNLSTSADYGNVHIYPQGADPSPYNYLIPNIPWQTSVVSPNLSTVITEAGYYTRPDDQYGVSPHVQAVYTLDFVLDAYLLGVRTTYLYELIDDHPDPAGADRENHFGLFEVDGKPKPAATALHNLTTILGAAAKPVDTASSSYTISGLPDRGHSFRLVKTDGYDEIVVWAEPVIWNRAARSEVAPAVSNLHIEFGAPYEAVSIYDPMVGSAPVATFSKASSVDLTITDHPMIVEPRGNGAEPRQIAR
jgi:hypothetical protein